VDEVPLVVKLRAPVWARLSFPIISVAGAVGCVVWIALVPGWRSIVNGGLLLVALFSVWSGILGARRVRRGRAREIRVTKTGLSSSTWNLDWNRVAAMWIGRTQVGSRAILIEPLQPGDVRWTASKTMSVGRLTGRALGAALPGSATASPIALLEANVDRPLEQLLAELEAQAGRSFSE